MATFKFGHYIDIHWNGYDIVGPADTVFSIPDQLYEEFESDLRDVEPTLTWIDTNEFQTLKDSVVTSTIIGSSFITTASTTAGTQISLKSGAAASGHVLTADGSGGQSYLAVSGGTLTSVIGVSPVSTAVSGGTVSVSLNASYQTAGTYVTGVSGTAPITASGTTAITVGIDQDALSVNSSLNAETLRSYVKNSSGSTISKGQVVYVTGSNGTNALIGLSSASTESGSSKTLGIAANTMTQNEFGYVIENGQLSNIDTSAATAGSSVWLGNTPGSYVFNSPPAEPSHSVYLGVVTKANASTGEMLVKVQNGYELDELHDVSAGSPTDLDIIQYKSSSSLWTKASISNAGIAASVHTHDYQVAGNYVSSVNATLPISSSLSTAGALSISIDTTGFQSAGSYQSSGTYVNAVIGTSPASVSTASGTSTVSIISSSINSTHIEDNAIVAAKINAGAVGTSKITSGAAVNGYVLTADGAGAASFIAASGGGGGGVSSVIGTSPISASGTTAITVSIQSASTSAAGAVQLTDSISSTSTTTAATPNSVKSAYDLANLALSDAGFEGYIFSSTVGNAISNGPHFAFTGGAVIGGSGNVIHTRIVPHRDITVSNISFTNTTTVSSGLTLCRFGIYTRSGTTFTLVARTASDTTLFNSASTKYTRALNTTGGYPATYTMTAGTEYWVSVIQVGTTVTSFLYSNQNSAAHNAAFGGRQYTQSSQADLPASSTGTISTNAFVFSEVS